MVIEKFEVRIKFGNWFFAQSAYWTLKITQWSWEPFLKSNNCELVNYYTEGNDVVILINHTTDIPIAIIIAIVAGILGIAGIWGWITIEVKKLETQEKIAVKTAEELKQIVQDPSIPEELRFRALESLGTLPKTTVGGDMFSMFLQLIFFFIVAMLIIKLVEKI